jgi:hypothetical protein
MKPTTVLGFGLLLLLFLPSPAASDEPEPFSQFPNAQTFPQLLYTGQPAEAELPPLSPDQQPSTWLTVDTPEWEQRRLLHWIRDGWLQNLPGPELGKFIEAIQRAHELYLFATEDGGRILRDDRGNPLALEGAEAEADYLSWQTQLGACMEELLQQWEREVQVGYQELLTALDRLDCPELQTAAAVTLSEYTTEVHREFERLYRQAESQFVRLRLKASDGQLEEVDLLTKNLTARTRAGLQPSNALPEADALGTSAHQQLPVVLDAQRWREDFSRAFERGIEAWNQAEQSLFRERIRWEEDARGLYSETEQAWQQAYLDFEEARERWIEDIQERLETGLTSWDQAESEFLLHYERQISELASQSKDQIEQLDQELGVLLSLYSQHIDVIEISEINIARLQNEISALEETGSQERSDTLQLLQEELVYWQGESGDGGALEQSRRGLAEAEAALLGLEDQIRAFGADVCPANELQREIARLESELLYLEGRMDSVADEGIPAGIASQHQEAYRRISTALELLRRIEPSARLDPVYVELKDRELDLLNAQQLLLQTLESLEISVREVETALAASTAALETSIREIFDVLPSVGYTVPTGDLSVDMLTDFSAVEDAGLAKAVEAYFSGEPEELSERISKDVTIWLTAMAALEGGCQAALRSFGLAYYYDAEDQIDLPILGNPNVSVLVDEYLELGPETRLVWFRDGKLVQRVSVYPADKLLPKDYLKMQTAQICGELRSKAETSRLYAYFRAMLASGHFTCGPDFIRDDLTDLAYHYIEDKARSLQHKWETQWWRFKWWRADEIESLRNKIAPLRASGAEERASIATGIDHSNQLQTELLSWVGKLEVLTGQSGDKEMGKESFLSALEKFVPADYLFLSLLDENFDRLDQTPGIDSLTALRGIDSLMEDDLEQLRATISDAVSALSSEHEATLQTYLRHLYDPQSDELLLTEAIKNLFSNPAITADTYRDAELRYARLIQSSIPEGRYRRMSEIAGALYGLMEHRLHLLQDRSQQELQLQFRQIHDQRILWETNVRDLLAAGLAEWSAGATQINECHDRWLREFTDEYEEKQRMWDGRYILFCRNREQWVDNSTQNAVSAAAQSVAQQLNLDTDRLIGEIQTITIPVMITQVPELASVVGRAFPGPGLKDHLSGVLAVDLSTDFKPFSPAVYLPRIQAPGTAELLAKQLAGQIGDEIYSRISLATALQMRVYIEDAEGAIHDRIAAANRSMADNLSDLMRGSGYRKSGSGFSRSSVIDNSLFGGLEDENQTVPAYRYFVAPDFDAGVNLSRPSLEGRTGDYIQELTARAQENLSKYIELIFGRNKENRANWDWQGINAEFKDYFNAQTVSFRASKGFNRKDGIFHDVDGLFPYHIGYEPVMRSDNQEVVQEPGYGQLGSIMEPYFRNEARQARGLSMLAVPWYNLRMWDDDSDNDGESDGWFEAPSARDAVNLAVSIAASATGNVWVAAALNLADDALFTVADVSSGYLDLDEGIISFGKQALVSAATAGTGVGFDALEGALGAFAEEGVCKALLQGVESATNRVVGATVNSFEIDPDSELMFNTAVYKETLIGRQALRSYLAEFSGTSVGYILEGNVTGFSTGHIEDVQGFSQLAGGLTRASLEYALTGQTILNLADFSMFGLSAKDRTLSGGFLELRIGEDQTQLALGQRGADVSLTALADAAYGMDTWIQSMRIRSYDHFGGWETAEDYQGYDSVGTSMRALYSFSDAEGNALYEDLLRGKTELLVGFSDTAGQTQLVGNTKHIQLATLGDRRNRNSRLRGGVVLQHEAHRDGITSDTFIQQLETRNAVFSHTEMALSIADDYGFAFIENDPALLRDVIASRIAKVVGDGFFEEYVDQVYESGQADLYSIEKWSGRAIGTNRKLNSYYVIKFEQDSEDAAMHDVRSTSGPMFFLIDKIHNLFSNKDRVEMYKPLYDIVGHEDYFGALKLLYGTEADVVGTSADVVGMIDDVISAYELIKKTELPGSSTLNKVSFGLETIDQLVSGVAAGINTMIEKHFSDYWWMSGVPNFATTQSNLEDLTRFMFKQFVEGTRCRDIPRLYRSFIARSPSIFFKHYETDPEWKIRYYSFGPEYKYKPYFTEGKIGETNGYYEYRQSYEHWEQQNIWFEENIKYWDD